jgi:hypothetical protein
MDLQRTMEFIVAQQAQFAAQHVQFAEDIKYSRSSKPPYKISMNGLWRTFARCWMLSLVLRGYTKTSLRRSKKQMGDSTRSLRLSRRMFPATRPAPGHLFWLRAKKYWCSNNPRSDRAN